MGWSNTYLEVKDKMEARKHTVWMTAADIAFIMHWKPSKTYRWLDKMVKDYWLIWRWHPERHGWHATKQYALPWLAKGK